MDLSKLYFNKKIDPNSVNAWEAIQKHHGRKNIEVSNIKAESLPCYRVSIDFYRYNRAFEEKILPYDGQLDIPSSTGDFKVSDFSFDDFPLQELLFEEEFNNESIISKTQKLYICSDCGGKGIYRCKSCGGEGKERCSRCRERLGMELCYSCKGEKREREYNFSTHQDDWITCKKCHGYGEISCRSCRGTGFVLCHSCGGEGHIKCKRCEGSGKLVKCITYNDYNNITNKCSEYDDEAIPDSLIRFLNGKRISDDQNQKNIERIIAFEDSVPFIESIDNPSDLESILNTNEILQSIMGGYTNWRRFDQNCCDYPVNENSEYKCISKILKVRTRIYQIHITRITYYCNGKDCELWLYGKDNTLFEESDLKRLLAEEKAQEEQEEREAAEAAANSESDDESEYTEISSKRRLPALLLSLFLGMLGGHRFYVGKIKSAIFQMLLFFAGVCFSPEAENQPATVKSILGEFFIGIFSIWIAIDFIMICLGKFKDKHGAELKTW